MRVRSWQHAALSSSRMLSAAGLSPQPSHAGTAQQVGAPAEALLARPAGKRRCRSARLASRRAASSWGDRPFRKPASVPPASSCTHLQCQMLAASCLRMCTARCCHCC